MCATNIINIILTAAIVAFACTTWIATRSMAKMTGLTVLIEQINYVVAHGESGNREMAIQAIKKTRREFPDIYEALKAGLGQDSRKRIEEDS